MIRIEDFARPSPEEVAAVAPFPPATLHEALGQIGAMSFPIKPIHPGATVCGVALTVDCKPGDNLAIHAAVANARPGDVLVVDYKGEVEWGPFGDVLGTACQKAGILGLVIDGCVRDGPTLKEMGFPVFAHGLNMKGTAKASPGAVGVPVHCGGVRVEPGDVVVGDDDGVVVVPRARIREAAEKSQAREDKEAAMREKLRAGETTIALLGLGPLLAETA